MAAAPDKEILLPLFPLPNVVFYPHTRMPLHVFEPRYRQLIADVLDQGQRFGIVLLRSGWEADYFGRPPLHSYGTMGTIEQALPLEDGRFNILLRGDVRFRILGETSHEPYRIARVVEVPETPAEPVEAYAQRQWLAELSREYLHYLPQQDSVPEIDTVSLDALTNALIMSLNLDVEQKQRLLEVDEVLTRAEQVGSELQNRIESLQFLHPFRREGDPTRN
jgi:Lon protease-like protein